MTDTAPERPRWAQAATDPTPLTLTDDAGPSNLGYSLYLRELLRLGYSSTHGTSWATSAESLDQLEGVVGWRYTSPGSEEVFLELPDGIARVALSDGRASVIIATHSAERTADVLAALFDKLPATTIAEDEPRVPVTFWSLSQNGPVQRSRMIDVPTWEAIAPNYVAKVAAGLEPMLTGFAPGVGGQLVLWHGPPGTGKTYALRALAWAWREWCDLHYITDPEVFFGDRASYMLEVLLSAGEDAAIAVRDDTEDEPAREPDPRAEGGRWKLLVLEDTGELMSADARERSGQGLSRLLNVVDGLIGQGLRILALVTTNEQIRNLHPAVARPGRCAVNLEFAGLPAAEAREWLVERAGFDPDDAATAVEGTATVADLFALREARETTRDRQPAPAGFGR